MTQSAHLTGRESVKLGDAFQMLAATTLNFKATNDAFEQGKRAYSAHDYDEAVKLYTSALETLQADLCSVIFLHRAAAYEMQNKLALAAQDCREANPNKSALYPDSYLTLGNILFLQNELRESANTYKRGIEVVPERYAQHTILVKNYNWTLAIIESHNQSIARILPFEVLSRILSKLSIKDRARLGMTCRFWNNYIFEKWPYMWDTVDICKDLSTCPNRSYLKLIDTIRGDQVKNLHIDFRDPELSTIAMYGGENRIDNLGYLVLNTVCSESPWKRIRALSLKHCSIYDFEYFSNNISSSDLCELTLRDSKRHNSYGETILARAVQQFPNLQTISNHLGALNYHFRPLAYIRSTARMSNFRLTSLFMSCGFESNTLIEICQCLPALTSLTIDSKLYDDCANLLNAVIKHCPALETLWYKRNDTGKSISTIHTLQQSASTGGGLKTIVLHPFFKSVHREKSRDINPQLATLFQRGHRTLQILDIDLYIFTDTRYTAIEKLAQLGAPCMQEIILRATKADSIGTQTLAKLSSACPSLISMDIAGFDMGYLKYIFDGLMVSASIQRLGIKLYNSQGGNTSANELSSEEEVTISSIASFLKRAQHIHSFSLNSFNYNSFATPANQFILELTQVIGSSSIRKLDLQTYALKNEVLLGVLNNLTRSQVRELRIQVASKIGDTGFDAFVQIQHLTHLIIFDNHHCFKEDQICKLLQKWQNPQMLVVQVNSTDTLCDIKGYKADSATMRAIKDQENDPMVRYSIRSSSERSMTREEQMTSAYANRYCSHSYSVY